MDELKKCPYPAVCPEDCAPNRAAIEKDKEVQRLMAEIERLKADYDNEIQQFNAGYNAFGLGEPIDNCPSYDNDADTWRIGWVWAQYNALKGGE